MKQHTDNGNITRQEAVSMVPPLALDVQPHHYCLDMCAAPGSKTSQLLEVVNRSLQSSDETKQGLVVANDSDTDRAYMLVHQCRRINSPLLIVTTHMGQLFPTVYATPDDPDPTDGVLRSSQVLFDRVLCDVPCSGDGTLRKNPAIWGKWTTSSSMTLHPLQLLIAQRGLQLLKEGGLMVYSTCSMSPYENEAVVAELLRSSNGAVELVDAREFLPLFRARKGLSDWFVLDDYLAIRQANRQKNGTKDKEKEDKDRNAADLTEGTTDDNTNEMIPKSDEKEETDGQEVNDRGGDTGGEGNPTAHDIPSVHPAPLQACIDMGMSYFPDFESVPQHLNRKIRKSLFPPSPEEVAWMHLERCLRCVPQDEDTGGFFVATLRKKVSLVKQPTIIRRPSDADPDKGPDELDDAEAAAVPLPSDPSALQEDGEGSGKDAAATAEEGLSAPHSSPRGSDFKPPFKGLVEFLPWETAEFGKIRDFYGLETGSLSARNFFLRDDANSQSSKRRQGGGAGGKAVYYLPFAPRRLLKGGGDRSNRLKVVTAGVKAFERKDFPNGDHDYRLLQDGAVLLAPFMTKRKVTVSIQDFCNILGGGLVSYSTLSASAVLQLNAEVQTGSLVAVYHYSPADALPSADTAVKEAEGGLEKQEAVAAHSFYAICWKGHTRTLNVMCGKIDIESMKHQLEVLNVLRPKIFPVKSNEQQLQQGDSSAQGEVEQSTGKSEEDVNEDLVVDDNTVEMSDPTGAVETLGEVDDLLKN